MVRYRYCTVDAYLLAHCLLVILNTKASAVAPLWWERWIPKLWFWRLWGWLRWGGSPWWLDGGSLVDWPIDTSDDQAEGTSVVMLLCICWLEGVVGLERMVGDNVWTSSSVKLFWSSSVLDKNWFGSGGGSPAFRVLRRWPPVVWKLIVGDVWGSVVGRWLLSVC